MCPLTSKLKEKKVHVRVMPSDVNGFHLRKISELLPEDVQTIPKSAVVASVGYVTEESGVMEQLDEALAFQFGLSDVLEKQEVNDYEEG